MVALGKVQVTTVVAVGALGAVDVCAKTSWQSKQLLLLLGTN